MLPCVRSMASHGWQPAVALMPERWTQLWQGQLSEETYRTANVPGAQGDVFGSAELIETHEQDEELIED